MKKTLSITIILMIFVLGLYAQNPKVVKVLTFNIYHGATMNGDFNLDHIADIIKDLDPDLVALQEVDFKTNRSKKYDLVTELGIRTKMSPIFGRAMYFSGGAYGNGVLSKYGFEKTENFPFPEEQGVEPRTALVVDVKMPFGDVITLISTHLTVENEKSRMKQAEVLNKFFGNNNSNGILAGDLNELPEGETIRQLQKQWTMSFTDNSPSYPSSFPNQKIDYVMYRPAQRWKVLKTIVIDDKVASDHCPVYVELQLLD